MWRLSVSHIRKGRGNQGLDRESARRIFSFPRFEAFSYKGGLNLHATRRHIPR